jgi:hypothetical protein
VVLRKVCLQVVHMMSLAASFCFSVSLKRDQPAIFRDTYHFQLRRCGTFGVFGFAITLRCGFGSLLTCGKPEKRIDIQGESPYVTHGGWQEM